VRVRAQPLPIDADDLQQLTGRVSIASFFEMRSCARIMSTNWSPTRYDRV